VTQERSLDIDSLKRKEKEKCVPHFLSNASLSFACLFVAYLTTLLVTQTL
jgi:hypothetical protein